jgi:hypothetical protein
MEKSAAGKVRAGLIVGQTGRRFLVVGANVYWDPANLGVDAGEIVDSCRAFYTHDGVAYFRIEDILVHAVGDRPTITEIHASLTARLVDV